MLAMKKPVWLFFFHNALCDVSTRTTSRPSHNIEYRFKEEEVF